MGGGGGLRHGSGKKGRVGLRHGSCSKKGVLGRGQVKKRSLPRHIPVLDIYVSAPPPPPPGQGSHS